MVRNGQMADSFYSLIQPEPNYYNYWCQRVHGLSQCDTDDAPVFSKVWQQLEEKIANVFFSELQTIDDLRYQIASIDLRSTSDDRVGAWGLVPHATSHTTVRAVRHTAVPSSIIPSCLIEVHIIFRKRGVSRLSKTFIR